jgi:subfamily B ATP-binding cassette protein MsbA
MFKDKILITIAHRLSTILDSDEIIFIKNGKILARGKHKELYGKLPDYKKLVDMQFLSH